MTRTRMVKLLLHYRASPNAIENGSFHMLYYAASYSLARVARTTYPCGGLRIEVTLDVIRVLIEENTARNTARRWQQKETMLFLMNYLLDTIVNGCLCTKRPN
jgi:hypothetical protein